MEFEAEVDPSPTARPLVRIAPFGTNRGLVGYLEDTRVSCRTRLTAVYKYYIDPRVASPGRIAPL